MAQNYGLRFDGTNDRLSISDSPAFSIGDNFTVEAWIIASTWRPEAWQGSILTKDMQNPDSGFAFRAGKNGTLSFVMSASQRWNEVQSSPFMNANQWYHVAAVVKGDNMTLFINGEQVATAPKSGNPTSNSQVVSIGESSGFPGRVFEGVIDEVRVWNTARTAQEIKDNQTTEFSGSEMGLVAYFPMNEGSGLTTANLADSNNSADFTSDMDETAWVEGYSIPATDVGVISIGAPDELTAYQRPVRVRVEVQNFGSESVNSIPLTLSVNGLPVFSETMEVELAPGESGEFTFKGVLDLSNRNANNVVASTAHPDDANSLNDQFSYRYQRPDDNKIINIVNNEQHNFGSAGQSQFTKVLLPEDIERFDKLLMHIDVRCPRGGCDPWDQPAKVSVMDGDEEFEIARFITPFGIACGPWTVDVTDFKTLLSGNVEFKSFVQVWGPNGWLVTIDLELVEGENLLPFQKLTPLWTEDYLVYGDPGVSYDLPAQDVVRDDFTEAAHMRMTISGHGQGNTDNAAEFSNKTHSVVLNGSVIADHPLWKTDCNVNDCSPQNGTWEFARAGWCPGEAVNPFILDLTADLRARVTATLDYDLESYTNLINTGYNGGSHTEPHYRIWSYLVEQSVRRYEDYSNLRAQSVKVTTNGDIDNPVFEKVSIRIVNNGTETISNPTLSYYVNEELQLSEATTLSIEPDAEVVYDFSEVKGFTAGEDHLIFAQIEHPMDENLNDDIIKTELFSDLTSSLFEPVEAGLRSWPNPTLDGHVNLEWDASFEASRLFLYDYSGKLLSEQPVAGQRSMLELPAAGIYTILLKDDQGRGSLQKVVFGK